MKICKDCKLEKDELEFYGIQGECKTCTRQRVQKNRKEKRSQYIAYEQKRNQDPVRREKKRKYAENYRLKNQQKIKARNAVSNALRDGRIIKKPCEVCEEENTEAHHEDYSKPLKIRWFCRKHHLEAEGKQSYELSKSVSRL